MDATKAFLRKIEETAITTLEHVRDEHFKNERVEIDGKRFTSCTFEGCMLNYAGGDVEFGPGCSVENCRPEFSGPARRTVLLLHSLGLEEAKKRTARSVPSPRIEMGFTSNGTRSPVFRSIIESFLVEKTVVFAPREFRSDRALKSRHFASCFERGFCHMPNGR